MKKLLSILLLIIVLSSCGPDGLLHQNKTHKITLYSSSSTIIKQWTSIGPIIYGNKGDSFIFTDSQTNKQITITGTIIIE